MLRQKHKRHTYLHRRKRQYTLRWTLIAVVISVVVVLPALALYMREGANDIKSTETADGLAFGTPSTPLTPADAKAYGIAAGSSLTSLNDRELNARLQAVAALGVTWIRYDFDWSLIQPNNSRDYTWTQYDRLVAASNAHHLRVLGIIDYTPTWARPAGCDSRQCGPANVDQFASFAGTVVRRYKDKGVHAWEVWNEPNNKDFWRPIASPAAYATLLKGAYVAIKQQDVSAYVLTAGLSPQDTAGGSYAPVDFLQALYAEGAQGYFDGIGDHPYTFPLSPMSTENHAWRQMISSQAGLRAIMVVNGDAGKKMWITEFGAPTGGPGAWSTEALPNLSQHPYKVDEALQAKILSDALALYASYDWTGPFFVYSFQDAGTDQSTNENFFGLVRYDGSRKPAYDIYRAAIVSRN